MIRDKFFIVLLVVSALLTGLLSAGSLFLFRESFNEHAAQNVKRSTMQFQGVLERRLNDMNSALFTLAMDKNIQKIFIDNFISDYEQYLTITSARRLLTIVTVLNDSFDFYFIHDEKGIVLASVPLGDAYRSAQALERFAWYRALKDENGEDLFLLTDFTLDDADGTKHLSFAYRVRSEGFPTGFIVVSMDMDFIDALAREALDLRSDGAFLFSSDDALLYETVGFAQEAIRAVSREQGERVVTLDREMYILSVRSSQQYDIDTVLLYHQALLDQGFHRYVQSVLFLVAVVMTLSAGVGFLIANRMTRPIRALTRAIDEVEHVMHPARIEPPATDETGQLANSINMMLARMDVLVRDLIDQQELKSIAEIESLSHQINPHFLYNILETISSIAEVYECPEISKLAQRLSKMFRYSLSGGAMDRVVFLLELKHVEDYIYIQRVRFLDRIRLSVELEEACKALYTLKFILQPIVENAVVHGLEGKTDGGTVRIMGWVEDSAFIVTVEDDGIGIAPDMLLELRGELEAPMPSGVKTHIGLINVHRRIQMAFGPKFGLAIDSEARRGTKVTIRLPYLKEDDL